MKGVKGASYAPNRLSHFAAIRPNAKIIMGIWQALVAKCRPPASN